MSKRNSEGEVLANRVSLALASSQRRLAALLGPSPESHAATSSSKPDQGDAEDEDLNNGYGEPEQLGIGGITPKSIEDGSFTRRVPTSNDKLLEQLIGKKKAKAHIAAKQLAARPGVQQQQQKYGRSMPVKKEESEDEEEGRAAAFKSKRRKPAKVVKKEVDEDGDGPAAEVIDDATQNSEVEKEANAEVEVGDMDKGEPTPQPKSIPSRRKAKPTSFLDEILAERSSKKRKKSKTKVQTDA